MGYNVPVWRFYVSKQVQEVLPGGISRYEVRDRLKCILLSRHFSKAKKKSRFLEFLCEQALSGTAEGLNDYAIGVDIYERGSDFDPHQDSIVRVQAHEIRKSLLAYYGEEGREDRLRIDLPVGGYIPVFSRVDEESPATAQEPGVPVESAPVRQPSYRVMIMLAVCCSLLLGWLLRDLMVRSASSHAAARLPDSAVWFWQPFLPPAPPPLVVLPVQPILRIAHRGDSPATWKRGQPIDKERFREFRDTINFREVPEFRFVPNTTDFTGTGEALGLLNFAELLGSAGQKIQAKTGRQIDYQAIKGGNTILLGGNQSWSDRIFIYQEGFEFRNGAISNKKPLPGEQAEYRPEFDPVTGNLSRDYGLVLMLANERRDHRVLLIYGIYVQGTQAAIEFVTEPERLAELRQALVERAADRKSVPKYCPVLLTTTVENYVPGKVSLVSTRAIPE